MFKEYTQYDAIGLSELVRKKEISALELLEAAISRVELWNPQVNAVIHKMYDEGKNQINNLDPAAPLYGVPFLIKDLNTQYKGFLMQSGSRAYRNYKPDFDSTLVKRYKAAGLITFGKTNTPEFGLKGVTEPEATGITRNPWNTQHTTGGSSGGSGAAVASGMAPMASAGDGGGSIRIPSSHCNLFGLKPGRGRMPSGPQQGEGWQGAVTQHVITRTVRDSAFLLDLTCGQDQGSRIAAPPKPNSFLELLSTKPKTLKIGFSTTSPIDKGIDKECVAAVLKTAELLEGLGHHVEEVDLPYDGRAVGWSYLIMYFGEMGALMNEIESKLGYKPPKKDFELSTRLMAALGRATKAGEFVEAMHTWDQLARKMGTYFSSYDLLLTPTTAYPAVKIGALNLTASEKTLIRTLEILGMLGLLKKSGLAIKLGFENLKYTPFTQIANLTGLPAMSIPAHWSAQGLPIGVHFIAPFGDEATLLQLAGQMEEAKPWINVAELG